MFRLAVLVVSLHLHEPLAEWWPLDMAVATSGGSESLAKAAVI